MVWTLHWGVNLVGRLLVLVLQRLILVLYCWMGLLFRGTQELHPVLYFLGVGGWEGETKWEVCEVSSRLPLPERVDPVPSAVTLVNRMILHTNIQHRLYLERSNTIQGRSEKVQLLFHLLLLS